MLSDYTPRTALATKDLDAARAFYEGVLGLVPDLDQTEGVAYRCGAGAFFVYPSTFAGTNQATAMAFEVPPDVFADEVAALRAGGVIFQTFDAPGLTWDDGVAMYGPMRTVWFADPDGNILAVETSG